MKEGTFLGKIVEYKTTYDPSLLVPIPRQENRSLINIVNSNLPFTGHDVWNAYEISCLDRNGIPFAGFAKIVYPCESEFIVESKSIKLYLNSFNMTVLNIKTKDIPQELQNIISRDLSTALRTNVTVFVYEPSTPSNQKFYNGPGFVSLDSIATAGITCNQYSETPDLLEVIPVSITKPSLLPTVRLYSSKLRSNCKVTKQPDWGDVYIEYTPNEQVLLTDSLFKYIISFRNEAHFHEEICETIFKRLQDVLEPVDLTVACFYTRRGGIDINPIRSTSSTYIETFAPYLQSQVPSFKHSRQ